jgi:hypothetical protein
MMEGVVVRDRRKRGVDAEARMSGRERDCMVQLKLKLEVEVESRGRCSGESRGEREEDLSIAMRESVARVIVVNSWKVNSSAGNGKSYLKGRNRKPFIVWLELAVVLLSLQYLIPTQGLLGTRRVMDLGLL